jgi:cytochrome P450
LIGSLLEVRRNRLSFVLRELREHGDAVAFRMGPKRLYLLCHPNHFRHVLSDHPERYAKGIGLAEARPLLGDGLLTSNGELAAAQRQRLQGAFHAERLREIGGQMERALTSMLERWRQAVGRTGTLDIASEMQELTLDVLGSTLLGIDLRGRAGAVAADFAVVTRWAMRRMTALVKLPLAVPTPANLRARAALRRLDQLADEIVRQRRAGGDSAHDLVSSLLAAKGGRLSSKQVRDEILTFLLAGHETTATTLAWTCHLLALHPLVEQRLHGELDRVLGGRFPAPEDLPRLSWTKAVIEEAIRLYPPVWMIPRRALVDDCIAGHNIPAGSDVLLSVYTLHRHPSFWEAADRFIPERFLREAASQPAAGAYLPFGTGPRACLGSRFGMMEATLALAAVGQRYHLEPDPGHRPEPEGSLTLRPRRGLLLRLRERRWPVSGDNA